MSELNFIAWSLLYSAIVLVMLVLANGYWTIMMISFVVFIGFDMIRPALTNYFSNIAGKRQGFAGGLNSTFTSMGNFIGPLVAGALFDVNLEFPLYMAIAVSLSGIIIIFIEKDLSHVVKKQINTQYEMWGPNKKNFTEKFYGQGKFGRTRWDTVFKTESVPHFFLFYNL